MAHTAYRWRGDLFCEDDIVATLTEAEPWSAWLEEHEPGERGTDVELMSIARKFGVKRRDPEGQDFPVKLNEIPEPPFFCSACLNWFS